MIFLKLSLSLYIPVGLLKLVPRSFKRLPCYGDAFFRLEKIGPKVDLHGSYNFYKYVVCYGLIIIGDSFTYNEHCQIRHLFSLKYISVDESGKVIILHHNLTIKCPPVFGRLIFKILPTTRVNSKFYQLIVLYHKKSADFYN